jgi:hypothetical protein
MTRNALTWRAASIATILALLLAVYGSAPAWAADKKAPTKPTNLRVTALTPHNVTLAWNASTDNSGSFTYKLWVSYGSTYSIPQTQTTFSLGLVPNNTYSFYVYAVDGSGNKSPNSNTLSVTTPPDTTPPTAPVATLVGVNPTEVSLNWTASTDDGLHIRYIVHVNGVATVDVGSKLYAVVHGLTPETSYEITVKAQDWYGGNNSPPSNVLAVTTAAVSATDSAPPSAPTDLLAWDLSSNGEVQLQWTESFDNQTAQAGLLYEIYLNGGLDNTQSAASAIVYAVQGQENTFTVIAVDAAGNRSAPTTVTLFVP